MSHYALNYVISEKSKKVLYSRKKAKYTKLVFSGWYSKKNDKPWRHEVVWRHRDVIYDVIIGPYLQIIIWQSRLNS